MSKALTLVFDLDGTLVDTAPDLVAAANHCFATHGFPAVEGASLRASIGFGARHMIERGLQLSAVTLPETEVDRLLATFLSYYEANLSETSLPFEDAVPVLERLRGAGHKLAICTNKRIGFSQKLLDDLKMTSLFDAVAGRDTFPVHKPDPEHLWGAIRMAGGDTRSGIMIGDTRVDVETARRASLPVIACSFGYSDVPLDALGADLLIDHFRDLEAAIEKLM